MRHKSISMLVILILLAIPASLQAQYGKDTNYWEWSPSAAHHKAVVMIVNDGGSQGSGVVINKAKTHFQDGKPFGYMGHIMTAGHVVANNKTTTVQYWDGSKSRKSTVLKSIWDSGELESKITYRNDIGIIWAWIPDGIPVVKISSESPKFKDRVETAGFGMSDKESPELRHWYGKLSAMTQPNTLFVDSFSVPGDSGGPIFNDKHELVGIQSGGFKWYHLKRPNEKNISVVWPSVGSSIPYINKMITELKIEIKND